MFSWGPIERVPYSSTTNKQMGRNWTKGTLLGVCHPPWLVLSGLRHSKHYPFVCGVGRRGLDLRKEPDSLNKTLQDPMQHIIHNGLPLVFVVKVKYKHNGV